MTPPQTPKNSVFICSPYAGEVDLNVTYAKAAMLHCLQNGCAPFATHLAYTEVLDDTDGKERELGVQAALAWIDCCDQVWVFFDRGISKGMRREIQYASMREKPIFFFSLYGEKP